MSSNKFNLHKIPSIYIEQAERCFMYKTQAVDDSKDCLKWVPKTAVFQFNGYNGSVNQWISLFKYDSIPKDAIIFCPIKCGNIICVNKDHLIVKSLEKNLSSFRKSPYFNLTSKTASNQDYYDPMLKLPKSLYGDLADYFKKQVHINENNCWIYEKKHNFFRYKSYCGTVPQVITMIKYGFALEGTRIYLLRPQCANNNCVNPDHAMSYLYEEAKREKLHQDKHVISTEFNKPKIQHETPMTNPILPHKIDPLIGHYNDSKLAEKVKTLSGMAAKILDDLDKCSDDIRNLEKFLEESSLKQTYHYEINLNIEAKGDQYLIKEFNWSNHNSGKMRLQVMFTLNNVNNTQPLIQMPAAVRLKCAQHLTAFCDYIIENY